MADPVICFVTKLGVMYSVCENLESGLGVPVCSICRLDSLLNSSLAVFFSASGGRM